MCVAHRFPGGTDCPKDQNHRADARHAPHDHDHVHLVEAGRALLEILHGAR
jgi:hypothetical protein